MIKNNYCLLFSLLILLIIASCKSDTKSVDMKQLNGQWEIVQAIRNGKETSTLDNAFFKFDNEALTHNLNGDTIVSQYAIVNQELTINDDFLEKMEITQLNSDTLRVMFKIESFRFNFLMKRHEE